jgi:hypothetical protein
MSRLAPHRPSALPTNEVGELVFTRDLPAGASMVECLHAAWIEAQGEAHAAYATWRDHGDARLDGYVVYRAAQDRADAAQDALALWAQRARGGAVHSARSWTEWSAS